MSDEDISSIRGRLNLKVWPNHYNTIWVMSPMKKNMYHVERFMVKIHLIHIFTYFHVHHTFPHVQPCETCENVWCIWKYVTNVKIWGPHVLDHETFQIHTYTCFFVRLSWFACENLCAPYVNFSPGAWFLHVIFVWEMHGISLTHWTLASHGKKSDHICAREKYVIVFYTWSQVE